jgi:hypothetical protein
MTMSLPFLLRSYLFLCGPPLRPAMTEDSTSFGIFQLAPGALPRAEDGRLSGI